MIQIDVRGADAVIRKQCILTSGTAGVQVRFRFSSEWDQLTKTAVFRAGNTTRDVVNVDEIVTIPHECLVAPGVCLQIGVYGTNSDQKVIIPTVWARTNQIRPGTDPSGDPGTDPTLPVWAMLEEYVAKLKGQLTEIEDALLTVEPFVMSEVNLLRQDSVLHTKQELPAEKQAQARANIDAMAKVADSDLDMNGHSIVGAKDVQAESFTIGSIPDDEGSYSEVVAYAESPVADADGNKQYGVLQLEDAEFGQPVIVRGLAPGLDEGDAATVGQVNEKSSLVSYSASLYANSGEQFTIEYVEEFFSQKPQKGDFVHSINNNLFVVQRTHEAGTGTFYILLRCVNYTTRTIVYRDHVDADFDFSNPYDLDASLLSAIPKQGDLIIDQKGNAYTAQSDGVVSEDGYNINVMLKFEGNITEPANAVLYTPQTLTPEQKEQARQNIGAARGGDSFVHFHYDKEQGPESDVEIYIEHPTDLDEAGVPLSGVVSFYETNYDGPVRLTHLKDGVKENDAATVGQLNAKFKSATLIVEINPETNTASHTPKEILSAVQNGCHVVARNAGGVMWNLSVINEFSAIFYSPCDDNTEEVISISENGTVSSTELIYCPLSSFENDAEKYANKVTVINKNSTDDQYPSAKAVYTIVGDIETALDGIIAIQEELIGGDGV